MSKVGEAGPATAASRFSSELCTAPGVANTAIDPPARVRGGSNEQEEEVVVAAAARDWLQRFHMNHTMRL